MDIKLVGTKKEIIALINIIKASDLNISWDERFYKDHEPNKWITYVVTSEK